MRIDFILGSPALAARVSHAEIVREERKGKAASDHAPVLVELPKPVAVWAHVRNRFVLLQDLPRR
jgi:hypothetical protein